MFWTSTVKFAKSSTNKAVKKLCFFQIINDFLSLSKVPHEALHGAIILYQANNNSITMASKPGKMDHNKPIQSDDSFE